MGRSGPRTKNQEGGKRETRGIFGGNKKRTFGIRFVAGRNKDGSRHSKKNGGGKKGQGFVDELRRDGRRWLVGARRKESSHGEKMKQQVGRAEWPRRAEAKSYAINGGKHVGESIGKTNRFSRKSTQSFKCGRGNVRKRRSTNI